MKKWAGVAGGAALVAGLMTAGTGVAAASNGCLEAGNSGFTAAVVATAGQSISRQTVDASEAGCDVGIFVDVPGVTISRVTVTGAKAAGILVMDTHDVTITRSDVHGNGFDAPPAPYPPGTPATAGQLDQAFAISLFGVSDSIVTRNNVHDNGRGGIGIMDDGPNGPGRVVVDSPPDIPVVPVNNVMVSRNTLTANYNGCAIVVSAFLFGNTVSNVTITRNTVIGTGFQNGADVGGIVAQSNGPFSTVSAITISRNSVKDSVEAGVIVHAAAPGSRTAHVTVTRNSLSGNNLGFDPNPTPPVTGPDNTAGVVVAVIGPPAGAKICPPNVTTTPPCFTNPGETNESTLVSRNTITDQYYGVWTLGANPPTMVRNTIRATDDYVQAS